MNYLGIAAAGFLTDMSVLLQHQHGPATQSHSTPHGQPDDSGPDYDCIKHARPFTSQFRHSLI
ncbi:hypothetical protein GCM10007392_31170 [Saccharospirillum salsuginis]|uniref:Uncharacterized protein n=1 Tax=Saccharospirillum salsuginis TaxID=418750 RepID=A0A918KH42_9GAMM|nr:hypothetical protein GCM10007392_31170 [Saccharospirillum salsuginis]